jgi:signal transduction histidine kinase
MNRSDSKAGSMRRHLTITLLVSIALVAIAVPLITYAITKIELEGHFRQQALRSSEVAARQSVYTFLGAPADVASLEAEKVRSWAGAEYVEFIAADTAQSLGRSGQVIGGRVSDSVVASLTKATVVRNTRHAWYIVVPVIAKSGTGGVLDDVASSGAAVRIGFLHLSYSKAAVLELLQMVALICVLMSIAIAVVAIGWGTRRLRTLTVPLNELAELMLQADRRSVRAVPQGAAEVRTIGGVFNQLMERIEAARDNLEATVAARTSALAKASDAAQQAERYKSALLAASTHEMKMPLHLIELAVRRSLQELEFPDGNTETIRAAQKTILRSAADLMSRIEKMLASARAEGQSHKSEIAPLETQKFMDRVRERMETLTAAHGNRLEIELRGRACMYADEERLFEVVCELMLNACKFTHSGTVRLSFDVGADILAQVSDTGCGIAMHDQQRIWEEFYQVHGEIPPNYPGQGLGLPMVKRLVAEMDGTIALSSALGQGTSVVVSIPNKERAVASAVA